MWKMETEREDTVYRRKAGWKTNDGYNTVLYSRHVADGVLFFAVLK
jgi:hypothetical protein